MKKILLSVLLAIGFMACQQKEYHINGSIEGVLNGKAVLQTIETGRPVTKDTADIVDGKFSFTGAELQPQLYLIFIDDNKTPVVFFGENKDITITANVNSIDKATIEGSPITDIYTKFIENIPSNDRMGQIEQEYQRAAASADEETIAALRKEVSEIMDEQKAYFIEFVKSNTNNVVGANMALQAASEFEYDEFKPMVDQFEASIGAEHKYVVALKKMLEPMQKAEEARKATEIGAVAPDFTLETISGETLALSSLRGNYLLVDFWASWCRPCRDENPNVIAAYNTFKDKGFDVLSVSLDRDSTAWRKAVGEDGLSWSQVIDASGDIATKYGVSSIPFTLLLDKDGKIVAKNLRGEELTNKLNELLN